MSDSKLDVMYILWVFSVREKKEENKRLCVCALKRESFLLLKI